MVGGPISSSLQYWLVEHPTIQNFTWVPGETFGSGFPFLVGAVLSYLATVLLLPQAHPPFSLLSQTILRRVGTLHNIVLTVLSLLMAAGGTLSAITQSTDRSWIFCFPPGTTPSGPTFFWAYVFYLSKVLEFVDTLLIILSGSLHRLSFLHVFHHSAVVIMCFVWLQTSQSLYPIALITNASVHVLMYTYYLLSGLGFRPRWKKVVTNCQIVQFVFGYMVSCPLLYYQFTKPKGCSGIWAWFFNAVFTGSLLALFVDFHIKSYARKNKMAAADRKVE